MVLLGWPAPLHRTAAGNCTAAGAADSPWNAVHCCYCVLVGCVGHQGLQHIFSGAVAMLYCHSKLASHSLGCCWLQADGDRLHAGVALAPSHHALSQAGRARFCGQRRPVRPLATLHCVDCTAVGQGASRPRAARACSCNPGNWALRLLRLRSAVFWWGWSLRSLRVTPQAASAAAVGTLIFISIHSSSKIEGFIGVHLACIGVTLYICPATAAVHLCGSECWGFALRTVVQYKATILSLRFSKSSRQKPQWGKTGFVPLLELNPLLGE